MGVRALRSERFVDFQLHDTKGAVCSSTWALSVAFARGVIATLHGVRGVCPVWPGDLDNLAEGVAFGRSSDQLHANRTALGRRKVKGHVAQAALTVAAEDFLIVDENPQRIAAIAPVGKLHRNFIDP